MAIQAKKDSLGETVVLEPVGEVVVIEPVGRVGTKSGPARQEDSEALPSEYYAARRKQVAKQVGNVLADAGRAVGEIAYGLATPLVTYPAGILAGVYGLLRGALTGEKDLPRQYEEALHELTGVEPKTEAAQNVLSPVGKAFQAINYPAELLGKAVYKYGLPTHGISAGSPEAAWVAQKAGELLTLGGLGKVIGRKAATQTEPVGKIGIKESPVTDMAKATPQKIVVTPEMLAARRAQAVKEGLAGVQRPLSRLVAKEQEIASRAREEALAKEYAENVFTEENLQRAADFADAQRRFEERIRPIEEKTIDELHREIYEQPSGKGAKPSKEITEAQRTVEEAPKKFEERMVQKEPESLAKDIKEEALPPKKETSKAEGIVPDTEAIKEIGEGKDVATSKPQTVAKEQVQESLSLPKAEPKEATGELPADVPTSGVFYHATDVPIAEFRPGQKINFAEKPLTEDFGNHVYMLEVELKRPAPNMEAYQMDLAQGTGKYDGVIVDGTDYRGNPVRWGVVNDLSAVKKVEHISPDGKTTPIELPSRAKVEGAQEGPTEAPKGRTFRDILSDINTAIRETGALGKVELTPEQIAARKRLLADYENLKANAAKVGKDFDEYLRSLGVDETIIRSLKEIKSSSGPAVDTEGNVVQKGDVLGSGERVRSFAVSLQESPGVTPEVKGLIASEITPGGEAVYSRISMAKTQAEAARLVAADAEKAVRLLETSRNPGALHTAVGVELIRKFQGEGNFERAADVALKLTKRLTKAGQEINQAKVVAAMEPESVLITATRLIEEFNDNTFRRLTRGVLPGWVKEYELGPRTSQKLYELSKGLKEAVDEKVRAEFVREIQKTLNTIVPSTIGQKLAIVQTVAQLLNPKTIITRNPLGNELFWRAERLNKYVTTLIDWSATKLTGGKRHVTFRTGEGEQWKFWKGWIEGWRELLKTGETSSSKLKYWEGWIKGWRAGWEGVPAGGLETKFDISRKPVFRNEAYEMKLKDGTWVLEMPSRAERVLSFLERLTKATLYSFDYAAYNRAYWSSVGEMAVLKSINETGKVVPELVRKHIKTIDENIHALADEYGKYATFQDDNVISVGLQQAKRGLNLGLHFGLGDLVIKYPRTPGALLARGFDYSPVGILKGAYELTREYANFKELSEGAKKALPEPGSKKALPDSGQKKQAVEKEMPEQPEMDYRPFLHSVGRAIIGTLGLSGMGYVLFDLGIITGPANKDKDVELLQRTLGTHPYRINVSALERFITSGFDKSQAQPQAGDQFYSYDWALPMSIPVGAGASVANEYNKRLSFAKAFKETVKGTPHFVYRGFEAGATVMADQPVLAGLMKLFRGYGPEGLASNIVNIAAEAPLTFTPTLLNQFRYLTDNSKRITYDPSVTQTIINKMMNRMPGLSGYLPEAVDVLGYLKEVYPYGSNTPFNVLLNPGFAIKFFPTNEELKVLGVYQATGSTQHFPKDVKRVIGVPAVKNGVKETLMIELTTDEYALLQKVVGKTTRNFFSMIPDDLPPERQEMAMVNALYYAGLIGRQAVLPKVKARLGKELTKEGIVLLR